MISKIMGDTLLLGGTDPLDKPELHTVVDILIDVRTCFKNEKPLDLSYLWGDSVSTWDVKWDTLDNILLSINKAFDTGLAVYVYCHGGQDRSPFVMMCYLSKYLGFDPDEAYEYVRLRRGEIYIHDEWVTEWRKRLGSRQN